MRLSRSDVQERVSDAHETVQTPLPVQLDPPIVHIGISPEKEKLKSVRKEFERASKRNLNEILARRNAMLQNRQEDDLNETLRIADALSEAEIHRKASAEAVRELGLSEEHMARAGHILQYKKKRSAAVQKRNFSLAMVSLCLILEVIVIANQRNFEATTYGMLSLLFAALGFAAVWSAAHFQAVARRARLTIEDLSDVLTTAAVHDPHRESADPAGLSAPDTNAPSLQSLQSRTETALKETSSSIKDGLLADIVEDALGVRLLDFSLETTVRMSSYALRDRSLKQIFEKSLAFGNTEFAAIAVNKMNSLTLARECRKRLEKTA